MARGKKKETLTPEERLQVALVPEGEQPYKVPRNWCWVRLELLLRSSKEKTEEFSDADLKYVGLEHMQKDGGIVAYDSAERVKSLKNVFHPQQILYGKLRPYLNKHDIATFDGVCSTDILVFNATSVTIPKFVNFFLDQDTFIEYAVSNSKGINLPRVSESVVLDAKCPLPPIYEQHRIVDRIESLFAKLDEAKQKAQDALDSFETRKAAILHKAFTGELTAQWRKEHGVGMKSWENLRLENLIEGGPQNGLYKPQTAYGTGTKILRIDCFYEGAVLPWENLKRLALSKNEIEQYHLNINDIVINRVNSMAYLGKSALIGELPEECVFESNMMRITLNTRMVIPEYAIKYLNSVIGVQELRKNAKQAVNQASINQQDVKNVAIKLPKLDEQAEIVRILDDLLAKEQQAKEAAEGVLGQIDLIKKAILARAFRGELGTNDPSEESAQELIKNFIFKM